MSVPMAKKKRPAKTHWPATLKALQDKLGLTNQEMAERIGVNPRTYLAWKYDVHAPSPGWQVIIRQIQADEA